ncbi:LOB domain-containing protein 38-like [Gastrolobium bilobum]|uniref:LOB domain-containing protein 38-like n=1 Tax=Gastrolobium bilobum TaxID=150636 RepID=UPI002AAF8C6D|nr:LOB domain-containing protein 38-like [Gastrolobium bilobum]
MPNSLSFLHINLAYTLFLVDSSKLRFFVGKCEFKYLLRCVGSIKEEEKRMSCNGCRVLRKGCSDDCMLRHCLLWIENPQAQAYATIFVAKFYGRATLMSFLSSVPTNQRSALFQSLLYEAVGRTINPVNGAVGLLWTGNWHLCQLGVQKVLRGGGALTPLPQFLGVDNSDEGFESFVDGSSDQQVMVQSKVGFDDVKNYEAQQPERVVVGGGRCQCHQTITKKQRAGTPSEESEMSTLGSRAEGCASQSEKKLLTLFF